MLQIELPTYQRTKVEVALEKILDELGNFKEDNVVGNRVSIDDRADGLNDVKRGWESDRLNVQYHRGISNVRKNVKEEKRAKTVEEEFTNCINQYINQFLQNARDLTNPARFRERVSISHSSPARQGVYDGTLKLTYREGILNNQLEGFGIGFNRGNLSRLATASHLGNAGLYFVDLAHGFGYFLGMNLSGIKPSSYTDFGYMGHPKTPSRFELRSPFLKYLADRKIEPNPHNILKVVIEYMQKESIKPSK